MDKNIFETLKKVLDKEEKRELFEKEVFDYKGDVRRKLYKEYQERMKSKNSQIAQERR